jgi:hypothetical protein
MSYSDMTLTLRSSNSSRPVLDRLLPAFETESGHKVERILGTSAAGVSLTQRACLNVCGSGVGATANDGPVTLKAPATPIFAVVTTAARGARLS